MAMTLTAATVTPAEVNSATVRWPLLSNPSGITGTVSEIWIGCPAALLVACSLASTRARR